MRSRRRRSKAEPLKLPRNALDFFDRKPSQVTSVCIVFLTLIAVSATVYVARAYLLPIATAFVFAVILAPICSRLEAWRTPRSLAALAAIALTAGLAYFSFSMIAEPAAAWIREAPASLERAQSQIDDLRKPLEQVQDLSDEVEQLAAPDGVGQERAVVVEGPALTQSLLASMQTFAIQLLFVCVLVYFFLITRDEFRDKIVAFQPSLYRRVRVARIFRQVESRVAGYIVTFTGINIVLGVAVGLMCWALGLPNPVMLGGLAGLLNYIPYIGPAITVGLLGLAGLVAFDSLVSMSLPVLGYLVLNFLEANALTPLIMGRRMTLNPLVIILTASFWTWIWGPVGGLISLPMLIMLKVVLEHTPQFKPLAALIGAPIARRGDKSMRLAFWRKHDANVAEADAEQAAGGDPYPRPGEEVEPEDEEQTEPVAGRVLAVGGG